jgi:hypothetical protein
MVDVTIFVVDTLDTTSTGTMRTDMKAKIESLYQDCLVVANSRLPAGQPRHSAKVVFVPTGKPAPKKTDLVIYLLPPMCTSIIGSKQGKQKDPIGQSHWGRTEFEKKTNNRTGQLVGASSVSELFIKGMKGRDLGAVAFHEFLHAKLLLGTDAQGRDLLHQRGGLASASVDDSTQLNAQNKNDIPDTLAREVEQWPDGVGFLEMAKVRRQAKSDSWWDLSGSI